MRSKSTTNSQMKIAVNKENVKRLKSLSLIDVDFINS